MSGFPVTIIKDNYTFVLRRNCSLEVRFLKAWVVKNLFCDDVQFQRVC